MDLITGGINGSDLQTGYIGPFVGAPAIGTVDTDDAVNQYQQSVTIPLTNFGEEITAVTLAGETCAIQSQVIGTSVTVDFPGNLATGSYTLSVSGATESATKSIDYTQTHPYTSPVGSVDSNSLFSSPVLITAGTYHRIVNGPSNGTLDAATAEADDIWGNDVADIYTPDEGFTGDDAVEIEVLFDDGTTDTINATITVEEPADTTPAAFTFTDQTGVDLGATVESNAITVTGVDAGESIAISVTGGEYAVDSGSGYGAFTSSSGTVGLNDQVKVRHTSSASNSTATNTVLTIGGVSDTFTSTTKAPADLTPDAFSFTDQTGVEPESVAESNTITVAGVDAGEDVAVSVTGGEYAVDAGAGFGAFTSTGTNVQLGYQIKVRNTASSEFETATNTTLTVGGVSDTFTRTTRAAVLPTQDVTLSDLNLGETDAVSIDLDDYFSGASSYTLTGIPTDSGLSFSGSVLSGNVNKDDIAASPFTLTATAISADGSINDAFSVTVVDDIGPVISVNPLTTLDTAPIVSGSAGDATSLTLVVSGVGTYNPTPSGGTWSQQLPTLSLGEYAMTLNGEDAAGNPAVESSATLNVVDEIVSDSAGLFRSLFTSQGIELFRKLFR